MDVSPLSPSPEYEPPASPETQKEEAEEGKKTVLGKRRRDEEPQAAELKDRASPIPCEELAQVKPEEPPSKRPRLTKTAQKVAHVAQETFEGVVREAIGTLGYVTGGLPGYLAVETAKIVYDWKQGNTEKMTASLKSVADDVAMKMGLPYFCMAKATQVLFDLWNKRPSGFLTTMLGMIPLNPPKMAIWLSNAEVQAWMVTQITKDKNVQGFLVDLLRNNPDIGSTLLENVTNPTLQVQFSKLIEYASRPK